MKGLPSIVPALIQNPTKFTCVKAQLRILSETSSPLSEKFASFLDNCLDIDSLKKLHACILTHGLENNVGLGSKLINSCARFNLLTESKWVFRKIICNDLSLWNSIILGYFRAAHFGEVLGLYVGLRRRKIGINGSVITFGLKSCVELGSLDFGKSLHVDAFKSGLNGDRFVGSSLIGLYNKYDDVDEAAKVFDEITARDVVVYTSMITAYAQVGDNRSCEAFRVAGYMQKEELEPNRITLVSLLQAVSVCGAIKEGKSIHGYAIRKGIGWLDKVFETSLMDMYMKCGFPDKAALSFGNISWKTIGSWNAMISGHLQLGQPLKALQLFLQMVQQNYVPDIITLANGVLSCGYIGHLSGGKSIHGYLLRNGFQLDLVATTALIDMYSKCYQLIQAKEVFDKMHRKDDVSFNVMIAGYLENGFSSQAVEEFHEMVRMDLRPNVSTILNVLSAISDLKDTRQGKCIHGHAFRHGFGENTDIANQLINMYSKCCTMNYARKVFDRIGKKDTVSWTSMITAHVNGGRADEAVILFRLMQKEKLNPDSVTLISLLQALAQLGCLSLAREVHTRVYRILLNEDKPMINCLITAYSNSGKLSIARNLFEHVAKRQLATWNSMISAYGMHGDCVQALKLFDMMKKDKIPPDGLTFTSVLSACSHSGMVNEGLCVFKSMKEEYRLTPSGEHYSCMVDLLSRAGRLEEAYELLKFLPSDQATSALGALLAACRVHGNINMGEIIGRRLLELEPQNPSAYNLVSNLLAEQEKWEEVAKLRSIAERRGLKGFAGNSMIEFGCTGLLSGS
ncbi:pentatricopeptide repeat-containing protein At2g03380, mitochondrial-like [Coffea arabica]|uniref:Pentatricopeptide repeat-containing protein At2g03380, mitochondrial-like n=1 Tax=Coffea arabica TaxID=13443 RepID=A0ABM4V0U3_COFAR